jgi:ferredoxin--NADP+ reductase
MAGGKMILNEIEAPVIAHVAQPGQFVILRANEKGERIPMTIADAVPDELLICTDNGSFGRNALVTDLLEEVLKRETPGIVVAIGPVPMMKLVSEITRPRNIKTIVSLNPIMIDGTGMCGSCRVEVEGVMLLACVDGPEFDGHKVNFDLLTQRLRSYHEEEQLARDAYGVKD